MPLPLMGNSTRFNAYTSCCRALFLCRVAVMNGHAVRNPVLWYGHTPGYGAVINGHDAWYVYVVA